MKILIIAPHADDETIGVGGTIARYVAEGHDVTVAIVTGHGAEPHPLWPESVWHRVRAEAARAMKILGVRNLLFEEIPAARVAEQPLYKLNAITGALVEKVGPDVLYVPFPFDLHKDHREIFHSLSVAWRPTNPKGRAIREIYCYEVLSETHWNIPYVEPGYLPSAWVDISAHLDTKLRALACYESQLRPSPDTRSIEAVRALAVLRGHMMGFAAAEAFVTVRLLR
ncbi:MAG: PIG-L family deacetylase [Myxococcota bacterium]|nr:PIG-L family deacetylase [Myxococcota bacterium]